MLWQDYTLRLISINESYLLDKLCFILDIGHNMPHMTNIVWNSDLNNSTLLILGHFITNHRGIQHIASLTIYYITVNINSTSSQIPPPKTKKIRIPLHNF